MTACDRSLGPDVALYFYGELDAAERAAFETHLAQCRECRTALEELAAIRGALAGRVVSAPPDGRWQPFMDRLDARLAAVPPPRAAILSAPVVAALAIAASLVAAILAGAIWERQRGRGAPGATPAAIADAAPAADAALMSLGQEHFDRSALVLLGLLNKAPADTWDEERRFASSLLPETKLYRLAAEEEGLGPLADAMGDLELVLLQASAGDGRDGETLERLQRLIRRRDLVMKRALVGGELP